MVGDHTEPWRIPLGEAGVLEFFQGLLEKLGDAEEDAELRLNALKIVGNACAEKGILHHLWPLCCDGMGENVWLMMTVPQQMPTESV